jgi:hypothetical protein
MRQLAVNAGKDGTVIVDSVRRQQEEQEDSNVGYDVLREVYANMVTQGICRHRGQGGPARQPVRRQLHADPNRDPLL